MKGSVNRVALNSDTKSKEIFEQMPVPKAVAMLAIPTILSQIVTMIYNLADTFFVGQLGDPYMVAAVSLAFPLFYIITTIGNLFGIGGGSLISRMMGMGESGEIRRVSAFCFYGSIAASLLYSVLCGCFLVPLLIFLGASGQTFSFAARYVILVIVIGGPPTAVGLTLSNLLRSVGCSKQASFGMMFGGILNLVLDPIFIFALRLNVAGAAAATAVSNLISMIYFIVVFVRMAGRNEITLSLRLSDFTLRHIKPVFSVGVCAALNTLLAGIGNMLIIKLSSGYGDIPVAAFGIVKKVDNLPINISMGLCQGYMPLIGYNFASGDYKRMRQISRFTWKCSIVFSAVCILGAQIAAPLIIRIFIRNTEVEIMGARFLRIACLAVPFTAINFLISYALQAMGKARAALILSVCRLGILNIPMLLLLNAFVGLYGIISAQIVTEVISIFASFGVYLSVMRKLPEAGTDHERKKDAN